MSIRAVAWLLVVVLIASGCASPGSLRVTPTRGQDAQQLERDRVECEAEADRERDRWAFFKTSLAAKVVGLVLGALGGVLALSGTSSSSAEDAAQAAGVIGGGAALGLLVGAVYGHIVGADEVQRQERAYLERYARCLDRRGYWVAPGP